MSDITDSKVKDTIEKVLKFWGGTFKFKMGQSWKGIVKKWKENNGVIVHLTAYGENIQTSDVMKRIQTTGKDIMIIVGSQKVPSLFFNEKISDFNVAVGNQPHSECSSLAVFLDRYFNGNELADGFMCNTKKKIVPQVRGKRVIEV
jgi:tRNA (cytidine56-2'-O)-methyltransferase